MARFLFSPIKVQHSCLCHSPSQQRFTGILIGLGFVLSIGSHPTILQAQQDSALYGTSGSVYEQKLRRVRTLVRSNVLNLAQTILETEGPPSLPTDDWLNWEKQLWALYRITENWDGLHQRVRQIPPAFPSTIRQQANIQSILAFIELQRGERARKLLRKSLLSSEISELDKRALRKLLIESYLADNLLNEASRAMASYQNDYRSAQEDWLILSSQVHLKLNNPDQAVNTLAPLDLPAARLLRIYARLQNGSMDSEVALQQTEKLRQNLESRSDRGKLKFRQILAVELFALRKNTHSSAAIKLLEQYLVEAEVTPAASSEIYPNYSVSDLVFGYSKIAQQAVNEAGLLQGDFAALLNHGIQLPIDQVIAKRSIYAYLLRVSKDALLVQQAKNLFVENIIEDGKIETIPILFGEQGPFGELRLSGGIGLELSNAALESGDIQLAAMVNRGLTDIPEGMDQKEWLLHVARISILAGDYSQGESNISQWIDQSDRLSEQQADQVLQPIFDLQSVNQHKIALQLLHRVNDKTSNDRHRREIAYWLAQSYQATKQYISAADYYLYSALQKDNGFDQWGESARFQAADSLLSANLIKDSRVLFEGLLARGAEDNWKAQLKQKLQEIWLLESSGVIN